MRERGRQERAYEEKDGMGWDGWRKEGGMIRFVGKSRVYLFVRRRMEMGVGGNRVVMMGDHVMDVCMYVLV